jgi:hypothetical protein
MLTACSICIPCPMFPSILQQRNTWHGNIVTATVHLDDANTVIFVLLDCLTWVAHDFICVIKSLLKEKKKRVTVNSLAGRVCD